MAKTYLCAGIFLLADDVTACKFNGVCPCAGDVIIPPTLNQTSAINALLNMTAFLSLTLNFDDCHWGSMVTKALNDVIKSPEMTGKGDRGAATAAAAVDREEHASTTTAAAGLTAARPDPTVSLALLVLLEGEDSETTAAGLTAAAAASLTAVDREDDSVTAVGLASDPAASLTDPAAADPVVDAVDVAISKFPLAATVAAESLEAAVGEVSGS